MFDVRYLMFDVWFFFVALLLRSGRLNDNDNDTEAYLYLHISIPVQGYLKLQIEPLFID